MAAKSRGFLEYSREHARRLGLHRFWRPQNLHVPVNLRARNVSDDAIEADARYGLSTGLSFLNQMGALGLKPANLDILEIGPGTGFGGIAVLVAFGARGVVADRWLAEWEAAYHAPYYRRLAELLAQTAPDSDYEKILDLSKSGGYVQSAIELIHSAAEGLQTATDRRFDIVFSNAVLEHVEDIDRSSQSIFGVTKPGGYGFHQIDFRDHRNFDRPLDHLLYRPAVFNKLSRRANMEFGSQRRPEAYLDAFSTAGFELVQYTVNELAEETYLDTLIPRLAVARGSPYRRYARENLRELGALFTLKRPA